MAKISGGKRVEMLNILVIGPTGHGGSYLCVELCERGHNVTGLSRNPATIGDHKNYTPKTFDVAESTFTELHQVLEGYDVVIKYIHSSANLVNSVLTLKVMQHWCIVYLGRLLTKCRSSR
jgi:putative NADH-flavin reductase